MRATRPVLASASAAALIAACSQPASHAVVDLSGSYGGAPVNAYSALTGDPVYQSVTAYAGPETYPDYVPPAQLAYSEAPVNQVASLDPTLLPDTYAQSNPAWDAPQWDAPSLLPQEETVLSAPVFEPELAEADRAWLEEGALDLATPVYQPPAADGVSNPVWEDEYDADPLAALPPEPAPIAAPAPLPPVARAPIEGTPLAPIESAPLAPIESAPLAPLAEAPAESVGPIWDDPLAAPSAPVSRTAPPAKPPQRVEVTPNPRAVEQRPLANPTGDLGVAEAYTSNAGSLLPPRPVETRLPSPNAVPTPPAAPSTGLRPPSAADGYPRPYELLRPGTWPILDLPEDDQEIPMVQVGPQPAAPLDAMADVAPATAPAADPLARLSWPVQGEVYRHASGTLEIEAAASSTVSASAPGRVVHVEEGPRGVLIVVEHADGWRSLTIGLTNPRVSVGQEVRAGDPLGLASREHRVQFELRDTMNAPRDALDRLRG